MKNKYWIATMPEIIGQGITIIGKDKEKVRKHLKREFYLIREIYKFNQYDGYYTFKEATEYFNATIKEFKLDKPYCGDLWG